MATDGLPAASFNPPPHDEVRFPPCHPRFGIAKTPVPPSNGSSNQRSVIPADAPPRHSRQSPTSSFLWTPHLLITAKAHPRHSRESGNPEISMPPCLSILASKPHDALYVGVTSNPVPQIWQSGFPSPLPRGHAFAGMTEWASVKHPLASCLHQRDHLYRATRRLTNPPIRAS